MGNGSRRPVTALHRREHLDREEAVAAEVEEVVVDADVAVSEQLSPDVRRSSTSIGVSGARRDGARAADAPTTGAGSWLRAIFLLGVSGKESMAT